MPKHKPGVLYISQWGEPGTYDPRRFCRMAGGDDDTVWFRACLDSLDLLGKVDYAGVRAHRGEVLPQDLDGIAAVILGGSVASVHDRYPWQQRISEWLGQWRQTGRPLLGICGGHQLVAQCLGGAVRRNPGGVLAGSLAVPRTAMGREHFLFAGFAPDAPFYFGNLEYVAELPAATTVLAEGPEMPAAAVDYGGKWFGVQFHPELTADVFTFYWGGSAPEKARLYAPVPGCERLLANFLVGSGTI